MESILELLLETLSALSDGGLNEFWERYLELEPSSLVADVMPPNTDVEITAITLLQSHGNQFLDVTRRILEDIDRRHLVQRLSGRRSTSKSKGIRRKIVFFLTEVKEKCLTDLFKAAALVSIIFFHTERRDIRLSTLIHKVSKVLSEPRIMFVILPVMASHI